MEEMRIILIIILMLLSFEVFSQEEEKTSIVPNRNNHVIGITLGIGGPGLSIASASIDVFFVKDFNFELGAGFNLGGILNNGRTTYATVTHHHSFSRYRPSWGFFYGFGYANYEMTNQITSYGKEEKGNAFYITTGVLLVARGGFTLKYGMGPGYIIANEISGYNNSIENVNRFTGYAGLKFGIHFGGKYEPIPEEKDFLKIQRKSNGKYQNEQLKRNRNNL